MQKTRSKTFLETGRVIFLPLSAIRSNPGQPRKVFDRQALQELAGSVAQYGVLQPVSVRRCGSGSYELIAGERRLRAARIAGLSDIPCIVMAMDEEQSGLLALVENLQRKDLDYIEEAEGIERLMRHSPAVLQALREHGLSERHARTLLKLPTEEERLAAIEVIVRRELTVAKTEEYVDALLEKKQPPQKTGMRKFVMRDVRLFLNSVNHHLETMKNAGIHADCGREETEDEIVLTIRLPKRAV